MKPSLPQGTRDFGPDTVRKRDYIFTTIRSVFELYGFQPLETPAMENMETLMGKYGEEGDKLIFKILNNGLDNPSREKQVREDFEKILQGKNSRGITERALKYDLTIPFARYVAQHHHQLSFPFKRYQIQPVWRADRPQKGRYREFYQCDADVVGSKSLLNEAELAGIYHEVFTKLRMPAYQLRINNRKILAGLAELCGGQQNMTDITIAIDKMDKIGLEGVTDELARRGLNSRQTGIITNLVSISQDNDSNDLILQHLKSLFKENETGMNGIAEIESVTGLVAASGLQANILIDTTLARGLNYYTGIIFEAKAPAEVKIGSIGGGGRYDDLTGLFGVPDIPGVGISFGVDRIYDVMEELQLFPEDVHVGTQVLFFNLGEKESTTAFRCMQQLRAKNVSCELFHENARFDKQFKYAEKKNIPFVIIIGTREMEDETFIIKDIRNASQQTLGLNQLTELKFT